MSYDFYVDGGVVDGLVVVAAEPLDGLRHYFFVRVLVVACWCGFADGGAGGIDGWDYNLGWGWFGGGFGCCGFRRRFCGGRIRGSGGC